MHEGSKMISKGALLDLKLLRCMNEKFFIIAKGGPYSYAPPLLCTLSLIIIVTIGLARSSPCL